MLTYRQRIVITLFCAGVAALCAHASRPVLAADPIFVGAGDIADCSSVDDEATAKLLDGIDGIDGTVFTLGDNAYPTGSESDFANCYNPTWGRHKTHTRPAPGNHDYDTSKASAYYSYFGENAAGPAGRGYYSYNLDSWHIISLNSEVDASASSAQAQWLRDDLAANQAVCTLAYWHKPLFSSGEHGNLPETQELWKILHEHGADVVLVGHDHDYERFAPQDAYGRPDPNGIREFVVGTGGAEKRGFSTIRANSEVRNSDTSGVLKLSLHPSSYDWDFIPIATQTFTDKGSSGCFGGINPTATPTASPTALPSWQTRIELAPSEDTFVSQLNPSTNYGSNSEIKIVGKSGDVKQGFLKFVVSGLPAGATILSARLDLLVTNQSDNGGTIRTVSSSWFESTMNWNNKPAVTNSPLASLGPVSGNEVVSFNVTSAINGNGTYSFAITHPDNDTDNLAYASSEAADLNTRPKLTIIAQISAPSPTDTPTVTNTPSPTDTPTVTNTPSSTSTAAAIPTASNTPTPTPTSTLAPSSTPASLNLLANPGFELDTNKDNRPDSWTSTSRFLRSVEAVHSGSYAGKHSLTSDTSYTISQQVNGLVPAASYSFAGYVNIPPTSDTFTFKLEVRWRNSSNSTLRTDIVRSYTQATAGWQLATASFTAPAGTSNAEVRMNASNLTAAIYVDDFIFQAAASSTPTASPTPTATRTPAPTSTPTPLAGATATPTATPATANGTYTFSPAADTYTIQATPTAVNASKAELQVVGGSATAKQAFLRFVVSGLPADAAIQSAKLRLFVTNDSTSGGSINRITNDQWAESINWNTQPAVDGTRITTLGAVAIGAVVEVDLAAIITGNGTYSFAITLPTTNTNTVGYASREATTPANWPQLIIITQ